MTEVTVSIDGQEKSSAIVQFYDGKDYMNDIDRRQAIDEGRMTAEDEDFRIVPFIRVTFPGRSDLKVDRIAITETIGDAIGDHERFPREWAAYKANMSQDIVGTPLESIVTFNAGDIAGLADKNIRSVETLANLTDTSVAQLGMGMRRYRDIARNYLAAQPAALPAAVQSEMDQLKAQIAALTALVEKPTRKQRETADAFSQ
jgi:hypothetical protein